MILEVLSSPKRLLGIWLSFSLSLALFPSAIYSQGIQFQNLDLSGDISTWYDSSTRKENTVQQLGVLANTEKKAPDTHPYFEDFRWRLGSVTYRGQLFKDVELLYNIENDVLISRGAGFISTEQFIQLNRSQISSFQINNSVFKPFNLNRGSQTIWFLEVLYEGDKLLFLAKNSKFLEVSSVQSKFEYIVKQDHYLMLDGILYPIKGKSDIFKTFKDNRKKIKSYAKEHKLKMLTAESQLSFVGLVQFCDELIDQ